MRRKFERFCYRHQNKGIPNLMLYIAIGNAIVALLSLVNGGNILYQLLCFDKGSILRGEVWRLVTYVFTQSGSGVFGLVFLYFFYLLGRRVELSLGTLKFNLFYLSGVVLMDVFAMLFAPVIPVSGLVKEAEYAFLIQIAPQYSGMAMYLHLSLLLTFATLHPDSQFLIMFFLPIKGWVIGLIYLALELTSVFNLTFPVLYFPHNLFPLVALANYFLFFGKDVLNLFPQGFRNWFRRLFHKQPKVTPAPKQGPIPFRPTQAARPAPKREDFNHRCVICGKTDVSNPELEFRYCSRCQGYHCYCEEHINNHEHVQ